MIPEIKKEEGIDTLYVDGRPFTMLCGEIHNSSASDVSYMKEKVWPGLRELHMNSVLIPVYWEQIEETEHLFDFRVLDAIIEQAEEERMKLGILWFGLWKNGISSYVPQWMKLDSARFFRAKDRNKRNLDVISPFCEEAVEADARAFQVLMEHIEEKCKEKQTVILVQVENEVGLLGSDRDYSEQAQRIYNGGIPEEMARLYGCQGTWHEAFGEDAPEYFMEYAYAKAIGRIAEKGKEAYPLPMSANAWIEKFPWRPGNYPSGGPIARFLPVWRTFAPCISVLCPDVYTSDFHNLCREYQTDGNPLLIPEHRRDIKNISHLFYAVGAYHALGFSPFGIEDFMMAPEERNGVGNPQVMAVLNIDRKAWECEKTGGFLGKAYQLLHSALEHICHFRRLGKVYGFLRKDEYEKGTVLPLSTCDVKIDYLDQRPDTPKAAGIIIESGDHEFYILGVNFRFTLLSGKADHRELGILEYSEGVFKQDAESEREGRLPMFLRGRILNGDERYCMLMLEEPQLQYVKWYFY